MGKIEKLSLDDDILAYLMSIAPKRASRLELCLMCGGKDRANRKSIERLRLMRYPIGVGPFGGYSYGVYEDVRRAAHFYKKKALKELKLSSALDGIALEGQMTIGEVFGDVLVQ